MRNPLRIALCAAVVLACLPVTGQAAAAPTSITISPLVHSGRDRQPAVIAPAGTLEAGQRVNLTVQTQPGATVLLWLSGVGSGLPHRPTPVVADANGQIPVAYEAGHASSGIDTIRAMDQVKGGVVSARAEYNYDRVTHYGFSTIVGFSVRLITVTALDAADKPVPFAGVYLTFAKHPVCRPFPTSCDRGGSAIVRGDRVTETPLLFITTAGTADKGTGAPEFGGVVVTWYPPAFYPIGGYDLLTAQDRADGPGIVGQDPIVF